jgi:signal transduction histidine kinase|tara:strand:+ start:75055 stop:76428 length:1374 start_codon:yes stop_codon:yes gene_type:complete
MKMRIEGIGRMGLLGRMALAIIALSLLQMALSFFIFDRVEMRSIQEDHARRVAELLVVSKRVDTFEPGTAARIMSTRHLDASVSDTPLLRESGASEMAGRVREQILHWEPGLRDAVLRLDVMRGRSGNSHLVGSMSLAPDRWLNFRSRNIGEDWPGLLGATAMTLLTVGGSAAIAIYLLRLLGRPLRTLAHAATEIGAGRTVTVAEVGTPDLRNVSHAMNDMQARIAQMIAGQAQAFEAISHDLRTPLSRLSFAAPFTKPDDIAEIVADSAREMEALLDSLLAFLQAQYTEAEPASFDLAALVRDLVGDAQDIRWTGPVSAPFYWYREPLETALRPLFANVRQYAGTAEVFLTDEDGPVLNIVDAGPGMTPADLQRIFDPFFRADQARARDTGGFGLGIPTAHRILRRFGATLAFKTAENGGLHAMITLPPPTRGGQEIGSEWSHDAEGTLPETPRL